MLRFTRAPVEAEHGLELHPLQIRTLRPGMLLIGGCRIATIARHRFPATYGAWHCTPSPRLDAVETARNDKPLARSMLFFDTGRRWWRRAGGTRTPTRPAMPLESRIPTPFPR